MTPLLRNTADARRMNKDKFGNRKISHQLELEQKKAVDQRSTILKQEAGKSTNLED